MKLVLTALTAVTVGTGSGIVGMQLQSDDTTAAEASCAAPCEPLEAERSPLTALEEGARRRVRQLEQSFMRVYVDTYVALEREIEERAGGRSY